MQLTKDITVEDAILCLQHAQFAEHPRTKRGTELLIEDGTHLNIKSTDTQFMVSKVKGNRLIIAFPCTQSATDVMTDLNARMDDEPFYSGEGGAGGGRGMCGVHRGFMQAYLSAQRDLLNLVFRMKERRDVFVVGYSLGGALSTLCAADLAGMMDVTHISAGSPRVGNARFRNAYNTTVTRNVRMVHALDCYATVPLKELGFTGRTFEHVGNLVHFDADEITVRKPRPWYENLGRWVTKRISSALGSPLDIANAPDHSLSNYLECLRRMLK